MKIETRRFDKYINVEVVIDNAKHDLGFHGLDEIRQLAKILRDASDSMENDIEHIERLYPASDQLTQSANY